MDAKRLRLLFKVTTISNKTKNKEITMGKHTQTLTNGIIVRNIANGTKFPMAIKNAAIRNSKAIGTKSKVGVTRTIAIVAAEHGVAPSTLKRWRAEHGIQKAQPAHLKSYQEHRMSLIPTLVHVTKSGKVYKANRTTLKPTHIQLEGNLTPIK